MSTPNSKFSQVASSDRVSFKSHASLANRDGPTILPNHFTPSDVQFNPKETDYGNGYSNYGVEAFSIAAASAPLGLKTLFSLPNRDRPSILPNHFAPSDVQFNRKETDYGNGYSNYGIKSRASVANREGLPFVPNHFVPSDAHCAPKETDNGNGYSNYGVKAFSIATASAPLVPNHFVPSDPRCAPKETDYGNGYSNYGIKSLSKAAASTPLGLKTQSTVKNRNRSYLQEHSLPSDAHCAPKETDIQVVNDDIKKCDDLADGDKKPAAIINLKKAGTRSSPRLSAHPRHNIVVGKSMYSDYHHWSNYDSDDSYQNSTASITDFVPCTEQQIISPINCSQTKNWYSSLKPLKNACMNESTTTTYSSSSTHSLPLETIVTEPKSILHQSLTMESSSLQQEYVVTWDERMCNDSCWQGQLSNVMCLVVETSSVIHIVEDNKAGQVYVFKELTTNDHYHVMLPKLAESLTLYGSERVVRFYGIEHDHASEFAVVLNLPESTMPVLNMIDFEKIKSNLYNVDTSKKDGAVRQPNGRHQSFGYTGGCCNKRNETGSACPLLRKGTTDSFVVRLFVALSSIFTSSQLPSWARYHPNVERLKFAHHISSSNLIEGLSTFITSPNSLTVRHKDTKNGRVGQLGLVVGASKWVGVERCGTTGYFRQSLCDYLARGTAVKPMINELSEFY